MSWGVWKALQFARPCDAEYLPMLEEIIGRRHSVNDMLQAIEAHRRIAGSTKLTTSATLRLLQSRSAYTDSIVKMLGEIGGDAVPALPKLQELLTDKERRVRGAARAAIDKIRADLKKP